MPTFHRTKTIKLIETDSTNEYIRRNLYAFGNGDTVISLRQTAGKGTSGRNFYSPESGLYMSVALVSPKEDLLPFVTPAAAVAVRNALKEFFGADAAIKWVNDILIGGRKVCGILCEKTENTAIVGIGINVCEPAGGFPEELKSVACAVSSRPVSSREKIRLARLIRKNFLSLLADDPQKIIAEYAAHSAVLGKRVEVTRGENKTAGTAVRITREGYLIIDDGKNEIVVSSGTLRFV